MIACTSPALDREVDARAGSRCPPTRRVQVLDLEHQCSVLVPCRRASRRCPSRLTPEQLLRLDGELHRQLLEDFLAEAVDDHVDRVLGRDAALLAVEDLVLADLRRRRLVLHLRRGVLHLDVRERVRAALVAEQQRVALRVVARARPRPCRSSPGRGRCSGRGRRRCPWRRSCAACSCRCGSSWCRCRPAGGCWSAPPSRTRRPSRRPAGCSSGTSR